MEEIDLRKVYKTALAIKWYIVVIMVVSIVMGGIYSYLYKVPKYKSKTTIVLTQVSTDVSSDITNSITSTDITMNKSLVDTYSEIIKSNNILNQVKKNLSLEASESDLMRMINVTSEDTAAILYVEVVSENPEYAAVIANEVTKVFTEYVKDTYKINNVSILDEAKVETDPYNINHLKDLFIFAVLGAFISCGLVLVISMLDTTVKTEEDIEENVGFPVIGIVPLSNVEEAKNNPTKKNGRRGHLDKDKTKLLDNSKIPTSEAFRTLRTNITFAQKNKNIKTILVTSSFSGEGKSYISSNLAIALAKSNKKVLIIDADMRKGRQNGIFRVTNSNGLSNALLELKRFGIRDIAQYIKTTSVPNLHLLTSGDRFSNPSELISSIKVPKLLNELKNIYDIIVIDGTPSILVADSVALAKYVDNILIVSAYKSTKIESLKRIKKMYDNIGAQISGVIINKFPVQESAYGQKYYYSDSKEVIKEENLKIKTVNELIDEAEKKGNIGQNFVQPEEINAFVESMEKTSADIIKRENHSSDISYENNYLDLKMENINTEINTIKNLFIQYMMTNKSISKEEFMEIKNEIAYLRNEIVDNRQNDESKVMKEEIDDIKKLTKELSEKQEENAEKVKMFLEMYRNKNKDNNN